MELLGLLDGGDDERAAALAVVPDGLAWPGPVARERPGSPAVGYGLAGDATPASAARNTVRGARSLRSFAYIGKRSILRMRLNTAMR